jgi:DNA-directed RNA polymerase specialized sigma24 family protein
MQEKSDSTITPQSFQRLLKWLDPRADADGSQYLEMRRRLVAYFDRKNCLNAEELADETLNRVARRLEEEGATAADSPARYCYIVARFVFMEHLRRVQKDLVVVDQLQRSPAPHALAAAEVDDEWKLREKMLSCLEQCTAGLESLSREIITRYYIGKERIKIENRRALAQGLGISMNALTIRACRIRAKLETCVTECANRH